MLLAISDVWKSESTRPPPDHHIIRAPTAHGDSGWASYIPSWAPSPRRTRPSLSKNPIAGFRNPWPSWHKPTASEIWDSFSWGADDDPCIDLAASHLDGEHPATKLESSQLPNFSDLSDWPGSLGAKAARLLRIEKPDFSFPPGNTRAKVTWLGHASVLVQLPSITPGEDQPVRCLFDPTFSMRCSPSQNAGPIRSYPPPCDVAHLPPIHAVFISHNHYDHMDCDTLVAIWKHSHDSVRFFVPLGNKPRLMEWGIFADRVTEMDWWDSAGLIYPSSIGGQIVVTCTPAQHNSWRSGVDADSTLWSSWCVEHYAPDQQKQPYRVFFAGDTGYQFHGDPSWPPRPPRLGSFDPASPPAASTQKRGREEVRELPPCPAFAQIRERIGPQHLLLLPVSVGASFAYLRSFVPLPDWINPFPRHSPGVTGANHMPPWDAVQVLKVMTESEENVETDDGREEAAEVMPIVAVAMHWGTFVTEPIEVLKTLGQLEWACQQHGVRFARSLDGLDAAGKEADGPNGSVERPGLSEPWFVALNHGQSVTV